MTVRHSEGGHLRVGLQMGGEIVEDRPRLLAKLGTRDERQSLCLSEIDILRDIELRNQAQFLTDKADAHRERRARPLDAHRTDEVDGDSTFVRLRHAEHDLHQRGLPRAVFPEQRVNLAAVETEIDALQSANSGEALDNACHEKGGRKAPALRLAGIRACHRLAQFAFGSGKSFTLSLVITAWGDTTHCGIAWQPSRRSDI